MTAGAMRFVDEFRDPEKARILLEDIRAQRARIATPGGRPLQIMEFCGGHTHTIFRYGIQQLLPPGIELMHGPGCPVCVLPMSRIDDCIAIAQRPEVVFTTFGDAMRVPGSRASLLQAKAAGADIRMVYSPLDALQLARRHPEREVVFFALGFETTMPSTALTVLQAAREGLRNFSLFCNHITTAPTLRAVLDTPELRVDAFVAPGHVSMVVGTSPFDFVARDARRPLVISGFEPVDLLQSLSMLLRQLAEGRCEVENQYTRVVEAGGNRPGLAAMAEVFEPREDSEWRGLGTIEGAGVRMRAAYADFDAERKFALEPTPTRADAPGDCQCGEVLKGSIRPRQCKAYGRSCTPQHPLGALMVSSEGACAAYYQYHPAARDAAASESRP